MHRALFWKEWRQLALVRWGGIALGAVLPIAFTAGAELAQRGLLPTGRVKAYAPRDLMYELLPAALALGLWPLIGLMSAAQAFSGDRAAGTEAFLLERPVPRAAVWRSRLFASLLTVVAVIAVTGALAAGAASLTGAPPSIGWSRWAILASSGVGIGLLAYLGGLVAASLLTAPMGAVLLGAVMGALPALLVAQLATMFPYARLGVVFLGAVLPILLIPAFVASSWVAFCRGEPAGRGRIKRATLILAGTLASVLLLFAVLAPVVTRANARRGQHSVVASPNGKTAFVGSITSTAWGGGWIVDVATGKKHGFVPPPLQEVAWSPDGAEIAIVTWSGPLGSVRGNERIDIRATKDGALVRSHPVAADEGIVALTWADGGLVAVVAKQLGSDKPHVEVEIVDPRTGQRRGTAFAAQGWTVRIVGPAEDRSVFIREIVGDAAGDGRPRGYHLYPLDVSKATVGPALADASGAALIFAGWSGGRSPSGRFARVVGGGDDPARSELIDVREREHSLHPWSPPWARWLAGDRLVWRDDLAHRTRLFLGTPGEQPKALREWHDAQVGVEPSEDGRAVFVSVLPSAGAPSVDGAARRPDSALFEGSVPMGGNPEELVYLPDENRWITLSPPFSDRGSDQRYSQWAGSKTLARVAPGVVFFEDLSAPGTRRFVIGGPKDLE